MRYTSLLLYVVSVICSPAVFGQGVSVNNTSAPPDPSAMMDVSSTTKGTLITRMTTAQRDSIASPAKGLQIYNTDCDNFNYNAGTPASPNWVSANPPIDLPGSAGIITGSAQVCQSENSVSYSVPAIVNATSYTWSYSGSGASFSGNTNPVAISFSGSATSGNLTVLGSNVCGNGVVSSGYAITVSPLPSAPTAGSNSASQTQIVWNWNSVNGATGYKWSTTNNYSSATDNGAGTTYTQMGLSCSTGYTLYVWAYNNGCNSSAATLTQTTSTCWSCGSQITDSRDGQMYNTVQIGTQCWMAQNLNYGTYQNVQTPNGTQAAGYKFCSDVGGGEDATCPMGGLYTWNNMMSGSSSCNGTGAGQPACGSPVQGICPTGWHIPSHYEWTLLEQNVGSDPGAFPYDQTTFGFLGVNEGANLKQAGSSEWEGGNTGTDASGFNALGAGYSSNGGIGWCPYRAFFWTSTLYSTSNPIFHDLYYGSNQVERNYSGYDGNINISGMSVRCVLN